MCNRSRDREGALSTIRREVTLVLIRRHPEPVIRIPKLGWNAASGRAARHLNMMPPGPAPRRPPGSMRRPLRILHRRDGVIAGIVPIAAPLVHVLAHVEQAVAVRL